MAYEPAQLESFLAVAQTGSFTRAASRLGIRQPTVSQHIRKLEEATGRLLVLRDTHSVSLTVDGEAMIDFARTILASYSEAERFFSATQPRGRLRLGMSDDLALTRLPQILRDFRRDNPLVEIDLTVDQSGTLHRRLENDRLDLYLGKRPVSEEGGPSRTPRAAGLGRYGGHPARARPAHPARRLPQPQHQPAAHADRPRAGRPAPPRRLHLSRRQRAHRRRVRRHRHLLDRPQPRAGRPHGPRAAAPAARAGPDRPRADEQPHAPPSSPRYGH